MSIVDWFRRFEDDRVRTLKRVRTVELLGTAEKFGNPLRQPEELEEANRAAKKTARAIDDTRNWKAWRELIEIHRSCDEQVRALYRLHCLLRRARELHLDPEDQDKLLNILKEPLQDSEDVPAAQQSTAAALTRWREERDTIEKVMPTALLIHTLLRVAERSRVEVAALLSGLLVLMGMVFTEAFYRNAIDGSVFKYVTLEDFLDEGVRGLAIVAGFVITCEVLFWLVRALQAFGSRIGSSHRWLYEPQRWILNWPLHIAACGLVGLGCWTWVWGMGLGRGVRAAFFAMKPSDAYVATVTDGTILGDVRLVGTTSRTATFLQVCEWEERQGMKATVVLADCTPDIVGPARGGGESVYSARALVFDRAQVVCHARGRACVDQESREFGGRGQYAGYGEETESAGVDSGEDSTELRLDLDALRGETGYLERRLSQHVESSLSGHVTTWGTRSSAAGPDWRIRSTEYYFASFPVMFERASLDPQERGWVEAEEVKIVAGITYRDEPNNDVVERLVASLKPCGDLEDPVLLRVEGYASSREFTGYPGELSEILNVRVAKARGEAVVDALRESIGNSGDLIRVMPLPDYRRWSEVEYARSFNDRPEPTAAEHSGHPQDLFTQSAHIRLLRAGKCQR